MKGKKNKAFTLTWTKKITRALLIIGVVMAIIPYILAIFDKQPCTEMGIAWITEIVAVCLGYFIRGFKDTQSEAKQHLEEMKAGFVINEVEEAEEVSE